MDHDLVHQLYQSDIKAGRNVIVITETHQFAREHIRIAAENYRYNEVLMREHRIHFERGFWLKTICSNSRAHDLIRGHRNTIVTIDVGAFSRLNSGQYAEFVAMAKQLNERTMSNG